MDVEALLAVARRAATAGAEVLASRPERVDVKGEHGDLVTDVDRRAEDRVRAVLAVTGEELARHDVGGAPVRWSIDPLDGTTNFVRGIPYYATCVAACDAVNGRWLVGVVHAPALDSIYWAASGLGAFRKRGAETVRLSGPPGRRGASLLGTGFSYNATIRDEQLLELAVELPHHTDIRRLGSAALDICLVADGTLDAFLERDLSEHDWSAAALIAQEAGLFVSRPQNATDPLLVRPATAGESRHPH
jgi:myo-inositol-1(or 4)-monophosphatase